MDDKIKVYIAAPWAFKDDAKAAAELAKESDLIVTSRWIYLHGVSSNGVDDSVERLRAEAINDVQDVLDADAFILLNQFQKRGEETSGKAVETGIAIAAGIPIVMVGGWTNVFHYLPTVEWVDTIEAAIEKVKEIYAVDEDQM